MKNKYIENPQSILKLYENSKYYYGKGCDNYKVIREFEPRENKFYYMNVYGFELDEIGFEPCIGLDYYTDGSYVYECDFDKIVETFDNLEEFKAYIQENYVG